MVRAGLIFFLLMVCGAVSSRAQSSESSGKSTVKGPVLTWENLSHDFGDIVTGDRVEYTFKFTNTGTDPVVITNVTVTCGCTTPKGWPRDPVAAGDTGQITVAFDSRNKPGKLTKVVTIISNAVNPDGSQLVFTANVMEKKSPQ